MAAPSENIAPRIVIKSEVYKMREYHNTVTMYKSAMAQAKAMLKGVINEG